MLLFNKKIVTLLATTKHTSVKSLKKYSVEHIVNKTYVNEWKFNMYYIYIYI